MRRISDPAELDRCSAEMAATAPWTTLQRTVEMCRTSFDLPGYEVWGPDGDLDGFLVLTVRWALRGYVRTLCVFPAARGKGLGTRLMEQAEERIFAECRDLFICYSSFNPRAGALYRRMGYEQVGEFTDYLIPGASEIFLRKSRGPLYDRLKTGDGRRETGVGSESRCEFRDATEADRAQAAEWMAKSPPWSSVGLSPEECRDHQGEQALVACVDGLPRGLAAYRTSGTFPTWLHTLVVEPGWQGRGLGSQLLRAVEERAWTHGPNVFLGCADFLPARHLYAQRGYHIAAELRDYLAPGVTQLIFRKSLGPSTQWEKPAAR